MKYKLLIITMSILTFAGCKENKSEEKKPTEQEVEAKKLEINNTLTEDEIKAGKFTPEVMWKMGRVAESSISPDGKKVVYTITNYSMAENKGLTDIYVLPLDGDTTNKSITYRSNQGSLKVELNKSQKIVEDASSPKWNSRGNLIYLLKDGQIYSVNPDTLKFQQISNIEGGIDGFGVAPTDDKVFYIKKVAVEKHNSADVYSDMDKSKARIYDDLMARHWNYWNEGKYSHIFVANLKNGKLENVKDIMPDEPWDAPMAPYFDIAEISWNNAGTQLAYTCKKLSGTDYAVSTDSDIYVYDCYSGTTKNILKEKVSTPTKPIDKSKGDFVGYDKYPVWSPDDSRIAFLSMRRPGNESDKDRLFVWNSADNSFTDLTKKFDFNAQNVVWRDSTTLLFITPVFATLQLAAADIFGHVSIITEGDHDINAFSIGNKRLVAEITKISKATELYVTDLSSYYIPEPEEDDPEDVPPPLTFQQISNVNKEIYDNIKFGRVQKRYVKTTDNEQMLTWVIFPPDFDSLQKYPTLLYCEGGPQSVISQFWSYRWNFELMAAQGYIVVAPNRRGVPSFGQEWLDQISGDYSGQNIKDYLSAIDDVSKEPWSDKKRLGCVGASYGGYSVFFLAGNHKKRFKAFIAHCGIFNFESMYGETEELWFVNNDYGGPYWSDDKTAVNSYENSPQKFVKNWDTPILIFTGENDFRIPYTQSLEAFTAARVRGIPARLVVFENEAHQVFKPQNSLVWNREFFDWLDKYLKK